MITTGIDVGSSAVKIAVVIDDWIAALHTERIRRRDLRRVIAGCHRVALEGAGVREGDVAYVATTGEGELVDFRRGHFYGMTLSPSPAWREKVPEGRMRACAERALTRRGACPNRGG